MENRNLIIAVLFYFISLFTSCFVIKKNNTTKKDYHEIIIVAEKELLQTLKKIPKGKEESYGFYNNEEITKAKIDKPFEFYKIENEELKITLNNQKLIIY